jgi:hypothetical protein
MQFLAAGLSGLSGLAAPLLKSVGGSIWEGIKGLGRDLFSTGKEKVLESGRNLATTIGN